MGNRRYGPTDGQPPIPLTEYHQSKDELPGLPQTVSEKVPVTSQPNIFSYRSYVFAKNPALVQRFVKATKADVGGVGGHVVAADEVMSVAGFIPEAPGSRSLHVQASMVMKRPAEGAESAMEATEPEFVLRSCWFDDVVGSTAIRHLYEQEYGGFQGNMRFREEIAVRVDERIAGYVRQYGGELVAFVGDEAFKCFRDARRALQCAAALQRSLRASPILASIDGGLSQPVMVRTGIHSAPVTAVVRAGRPGYDGQTVHIAHRHVEYAAARQILVSPDTRTLAGRIEGLRYVEYHGYPFDGLPGLHTLVEVLYDDQMPQRPRRPRQRNLHP